MIRVAGVDVSSLAVDIVTLTLDENEDGHAGEWHHFALVGDDAKQRALRAADVIPRGTFWDDISTVAIEQPFGRLNDRGALFAMHVAIGAVVAAMPERLRPPMMLAPQTWRKHSGVGGKATKPQVRAHALRTIPGLSRALPQDVYDAVCIARAARALVAQMRLEAA